MQLDGPAIEAIRIKRKLSREKLARLADTSTRTIVRIEREGADPGGSIIARLAAALDVSMDDLYTENGPGEAAA
jgi:DNA-binding XRE family transcriptional regulator